ncbi:MAG: nuclear transport factor 2 family protein [Sphingobacteriaceae bacterium]
MKKLSILLFVLTLTLSLKAQTKAEKQVAAVSEQLRLAMVDPDKGTLQNILSDNLSYGHSGGKVEDKASLIEALTSGRSDFVSINLTNQTIKISGKVALVRHLLEAQTNDSGKPAEVHLAVLQVWEKKGGSWKMLARQAVKK